MSCRRPSWKIKTRIPKAALSERMFITKVLIGISTDPVMAKMTSIVTTATTRMAAGRCEARLAWRSAKLACSTGTWTGYGELMARMSRTSCWLCGVNGSDEGTTSTSQRWLPRGCAGTTAVTLASLESDAEYVVTAAAAWASAGASRTTRTGDVVWAGNSVLRASETALADA